jgi:hypothetical protein
MKHGRCRANDSGWKSRTIVSRRPFSVEGPARLDRVILMTELAHQARRIDPGPAEPRATSLEYPPPTARTEDPVN